MIRSGECNYVIPLDLFSEQIYGEIAKLFKTKREESGLGFSCLTKSVLVCLFFSYE